MKSARDSLRKVWIGVRINAFVLFHFETYSIRFFFIGTNSDETSPQYGPKSPAYASQMDIDSYSEFSSHPTSRPQFDQNDRPISTDTHVTQDKSVNPLEAFGNVPNLPTGLIEKTTQIQPMQQSEALFDTFKDDRKYVWDIFMLFIIF